MDQTRPTLEGLEQTLELIAKDSRLPPNYSEWVRASLRTGGWKVRILQYILDHAPATSTRPALLDVGAQFGSMALYAAKVGCRVAAVDYGPYAKLYREIAAERGVDYRECDLGSGSLPFPDGVFDFVTYTDVIEHHSFSSKRVLRDIHRVLVPGGRLILLTPNHAAIYNRLKLLAGRSVLDDLDYFFDTCAEDPVYDGHHREYTRAEVRVILERTQFRVRECRVIEQELGPLLQYRRRHPDEARALAGFRDVILCALGKIWEPLRLPFGRWIWAVGEKVGSQEMKSANRND
jgi:SAM-dependent methyltransferase